jgi:hypothetical protein
MTYVKSRKSALACQTVAVLGIERVVPLVTDAACSIDRLCPSVGTDDTDALAETTRGFNAQGVITAVPSIVHELDIAETGIRLPRCNGPQARDRLVHVLESLQVTALRPQVADFDGPVRC